MSRDIVIMQGCKTAGIVIRSQHDLNLCNDPTCGSCNMYHELLAEEAKTFLMNDANFIQPPNDDISTPPSSELPLTLHQLEEWFKKVLLDNSKSK